MEPSPKRLNTPAGATGTSTNHRLLSMEQDFHLYVTLLGSSPKVCETDLVTFVLRHLDYFLKKVVQAELAAAGTSDFEDALIEDWNHALIGDWKRPFYKVAGNHFRYSTLLLFVDCMQQASPLDWAACTRFSIYEDVLSRSENALLATLHASYSEEEQQALLRDMRQEILTFLKGHMKDDRDGDDRDDASHVFCDLLWIDVRSSLEELDLEGDMPNLNRHAFDISNPIRLENMALKVLVLKDLEARFRLNKIGKFTHEVMKAALKLVRSCIERNVAVSRKVVCGSMEASIPGLQDGGDLDLVVLDPPPSMAMQGNSQLHHST